MYRGSIGALGASLGCNATTQQRSNAATMQPELLALGLLDAGMSNVRVRLQTHDALSLSQATAAHWELGLFIGLNFGNICMGDHLRVCYLCMYLAPQFCYASQRIFDTCVAFWGVQAENNGAHARGEGVGCVKYE